LKKEFANVTAAEQFPVETIGRWSADSPHGVGKDCDAKYIYMVAPEAVAYSTHLQSEFESLGLTAITALG
jgi:hypothetical protein